MNSSLMYVCDVSAAFCMYASDFDMILSYLKAHNFKVLIFFCFVIGVQLIFCQGGLRTAWELEYSR